MKCYCCSEAELGDDTRSMIRGRIEGGKEVGICNQCYANPKAQSGIYWVKIN